MVLNSGCKFENLGAQRKKSLPQRGCKFEDPTREDENPFRNGLYFFGAGGAGTGFSTSLATRTGCRMLSKIGACWAREAARLLCECLDNTVVEQFPNFWRKYATTTYA